MPTGRPKGTPKTGGRQKGTPNKRSLAFQKEVRGSGLMPLEYMLAVMRDTQADFSRRDDMAKAAAPYVHPRLAATEVYGKNGGPIQHEDVTDEALIEAILAHRERKKSAKE
jgi:hypothetical protein